MKRVDIYIKKYEDVKDIKLLNELDTFELVGYYMSNFPADPVSRLNYDRLENRLSYTKSIGVDKILTALKRIG